MTTTNNNHNWENPSFISFNNKIKNLPLKEKEHEQPQLTDKQLKDDMYAYYNIRERILIKELSELYPKLYVNSVTPVIGMDFYDCILSSATTNKIYETEIKVRRRKSTNYNNWFVEARKLYGYHLNEDCKLQRDEDYHELNTNRLFIIFFQDKTYIWDLNKIKDEKVFYNKYLTHNSILGNKKKKDKMICDIYLSEAICYSNYKFNDDKLHKKALKQFREIKGYDWTFYSE